MESARKHGKPHLHLCAGNDTSADNLRAFFEYHDVKVLNVAGPRASKEPGVGQFVMALMDEVLGAWTNGQIKTETGRLFLAS